MPRIASKVDKPAGGYGGRNAPDSYGTGTPILEFQFWSFPLINRPRQNEALQDVLLRMSGGKELLRLKEASDLLSLDYKVLYFDAVKGVIPAYRFGSIWYLTIPDIAAHMTKGGKQPDQQSALGQVVESLNPLDPEDYVFRQELDSYISDRVKEVSSQHKLKTPYATAFVVAEVSGLLEPEKEEEQPEPDEPVQSAKAGKGGRK
ncbi:hypothetical protein HYU17_01275 [Candidatus Woesearchaeota archaeon]|nr:hypothetical protein [Candidatus Woesearchaeota archaeon]